MVPSNKVTFVTLHVCVRVTAKFKALLMLFVHLEIVGLIIKRVCFGTLNSPTKLTNDKENNPRE